MTKSPNIRASDGLVVNQAPAGLGHTATIPDAGEIEQPMSAIVRIFCFVSGLAVVCGAFAFFGLMFDFVEAVRRTWSMWAVFAAIPVFATVATGIFVIGGGFMCLGLMGTGKDGGSKP